MLPNMRKNRGIYQKGFDNDFNGYYQSMVGDCYSWNSGNLIGVYYYDMLNKLRYLICLKLEE